MNRLPEEDLDRIARRVAARVTERIVLIVFAAVVAVWVVPYLAFAFLTTAASATRGLPFAISVVLLATVLAAPLIALILMRARRSA